MSRNTALTLHRALSTILRTVIAALAIGAAVSYLHKPVYRSSCRILLESNGGISRQLEGNMLAPMIHENSASSIPTQVEILKSEPVFEEACRDGLVPPNKVKVNGRQVDGTDVVDIAAEASISGYAMHMAYSLANTYMYSVQGSTWTEVEHALASGAYRVKEEKFKLAAMQNNLHELNANSAPFTTQAELSDSIDRQQSNIVELEKDVDELKFKARFARNAVTIINPASQPQLITRTRSVTLAKSIVIGLAIGLLTVVVQSVLAGSKEQR